MSKMKILCLIPLQSDPEDPVAKSAIDLAERVYLKIKRPDTQIVMQSVERGLTTMGQEALAALHFLNQAEVLKAVIRAEWQGFDAVVIVCVGDSALRPARSALSIPVVGPGETAMHLACTMGLRFAIVTADAGYIPNLEENIDRYGLRDNLIGRNPVRTITLSEKEFMGCLSGNYKPVVNNFTTIARGCIEDGAEVLIAGCGVLSNMLTDAGLMQVDGVPVIDPEIIALKTAEMLVDMHRANIPIVSRKGIYALTPRKALEEVKDTFGL